MSFMNIVLKTRNKTR